jgi:hypothetical protein
MATRTISVNRAPVLTLWAEVVAKRKPREARKRAHGEEFWIELLGRLIRVRNIPAA